MKSSKVLKLTVGLIKPFTIMVFCLIVSALLVFSCKQENVSPISSEKDIKNPSALRVTSGIDSLGLVKIKISYRSPIGSVVSKGFIMVKGLDLNRKINFTENNVDLDFGLVKKGQYTIGVLENSIDGKEYTEQIDIKL